jgi:hypothetical protein
MESITNNLFVKTFLFCLSLYLLPTNTKCQTVLASTSSAVFVHNWSEKVYVQTDRSYYLPGDTIWMKALVKYSNPVFKDSLSKVLHIDLYSANKIMITKALLQIKNGECANGIVIPTKLPTGDYYLLAYTKWMLNFSDYFIKALPIGNVGKFIKPKNLDTASSLPHGLKLLVDMEEYINSRQNVSIKIKASETTDRIKTLSVSFTELNSNAAIKNSPSITSFNNQFKGESLKVLTVNHIIENSIVYKGQVHKVFNEKRELNPVFKDAVTVKALVPTQKKSYLAHPAANGKFEIGLDYADTASVSFVGETKKGVLYGDIEIFPLDTVTVDFTPLAIDYEFENYTPQNMRKQFIGEVKILEEVIVKARKIELKKSPRLPMVTIPLGLVHKSSKVEDVKAMRKMNFLGNAIQYMVQGQEIEILNDDGRPTDVFYFGINRGTTIPYRFYLNGNRIYYNDLRYMTAAVITKLSVYGSEGSSGAGSINKQALILSRNAFNPVNPEDIGGPIAGNVLIYTEPYVEATLEPKPYTTYQLKGYDKILHFSPLKVSRELNFRPTVYWNPFVQLNANREANITFTNSDFEGQFKLIVEGITEMGKPIRVVKIINAE